ncbi:MAG: hypothetical protein IJC52_05125, partial [Clostridia bacterium]|nr:hypothetical protein [Clostridia bacterium]
MKIKKALALFAALATLLTAFSGLTLTASAATLSTKTYNMTQLEGYYKPQGRTERTGDVLCMDNAADGLEFYYYGKGDLSAT